MRPDAYFRQLGDLETLDEQRRGRNAEADAASAEIARLERIRRVRQALARHAEAVAWLDAHPEAPSLSPALGQALAAARLDAAAREGLARQARDDLARTHRDADDIALDTALLARAEDIERLAGEAGAARKARNDLPSVRGQHESGLARLGDLLRQLGSPLPPARAIETVPTRALRARTQRLIDEHIETDGSRRDAEARIAARADELSGLERQLSQAPPPPNAEPLEILLDAIRADGNPAQRRAEADQALSKEDSAVAAACARVPGWTADAEELAALRPLTMEIYNAHANALFTCHTDAQTAHRRRDDEAARLEQARAALAAIELGGAVPDEAALDEARGHRGALWRLIWRRAFADDPAPPEDEQAHTGGTPLPLAFDRSLHDADTIADRRFREADLVARLDNARLAVAESERRAGAATGQARVAGEKLAQARRAWTQVCAALPLGEEPALEDIRAFLTTRGQVIEARQRHALAAAAAAGLHRRHAVWAEALADHLGQTGSDLATLLPLADRTLAQTRKRQRERSDLETQRARAERELHDARTAFAALEDKHLQWAGRWASVLSGLGRPEREEPVETRAVLTVLEDIAREHTGIAQLTERIAGMDAEIERFTREVRTLAGALPAAPAANDPFEAARTLRAALTRERGREERRRVLGETLDNARARTDAADKALDLARITLGAHLDLIGAETVGRGAASLPVGFPRRDDSPTASWRSSAAW